MILAGDSRRWNYADLTRRLHTDTLQVKTTYPVPQYVHGISLDFHGYVWGVTMSSEAYRLDINQGGTFQTVAGLVGAYTYSDMTGFALSNVSQ